ncbi:MAG: phospholipase D family protein [Planctomycetes bacterium]|nr:phospholipase D family protein [Planctomycetota bacterium]
MNPSGVFHPKIYLFEGKNRWECVIGSPNFTYGGLGGNDEVATLLSDADQGAADAYRAVKAVIEQYWQRGSVMSAADLEGYRQMWSARLRVRAQLGDTSRTGAKPTGDGGRSPLEIPILRLPWSEFVSRARAEDTGHSIVGRLAVLDHVRTQFKGGTSFCDIDTVWRKRIAGTTYERFDEAGDDPNWLWFGSMRGAGTFKSLVADNSSHLSDALDAIPSAGEVSREQYELFVHRFTKAFAGRPGGGPGIGTASRLLAMKRPDYFVCLDSKNRAGLRKAFGIRGACGLAEYWDSIVERIRSAAWWLADAPTAGEDAEIWKGRAAMLDALYYEG